MALPLPILHGNELASGWLYSDWQPEWSVLIGILALVVAYFVVTGSRNRAADGSRLYPVKVGQRTAFLSGCLLILIALNPPLDDWSDGYLMSAHMLQHLLLVFGGIPLLLKGTPGWLAERLLAPRLLNRVMFRLTRPMPALVISNVILVVWHMPFSYDGALRNEPVHIIQHLTFMAAAVLMWWPIIGPMPSWPKMTPLLQCLYIFIEGVPGGIVGAFITLAAPGLYATYVDAPRIFGLSLATDQEISGLMMWVLTSVIYLLWITVIFLSWASREEAKDNEQSRSGAPVPVDPASAARTNG